MNKLVLVLVFSLIAFSQSAQAPRDFLQEFFAGIKGKEFHLDEQCFGPEFDDQWAAIVESFEDHNYLLLVLTLEQMGLEAYKKCPVPETLELVKRFWECLETGEIFKDPLERLVKILEIIKEEVGQKVVTPANLGHTLGGIVNVVLYDTLEFKFLDPDMFTPVEIEGTADDLLDGLLEGVSGVPYAQNKCKNDIASDRKMIVDAFNKVIQAIKTKTGVIEALEDVYNVILNLSQIDANCHFTVLAKNIKTLTTKIGLAAAGYRIVRHLPTVLTGIENISVGIHNGDLKMTGLGIGKIVRIVLDYSTN